LQISTLVQNFYSGFLKFEFEFKIAKVQCQSNLIQAENRSFKFEGFIYMRDFAMPQCNFAVLFSGNAPETLTAKPLYIIALQIRLQNRMSRLHCKKIALRIGTSGKTHLEIVRVNVPLDVPGCSDV
jgi:hypothetical protein